MSDEEVHKEPPERVVLFSLALIPCLALLSAALYNIYRQHHFPPDKVERFYWIRWASVICCTQQLLVFIGYLTDEIIITQIAWNTWIPTALFCLTIVSIRVSESYIQIRCIAFTINRKHIHIAYTSWALATLFNWTGTFCGFAFGAPVPQSFFYATWKLLAAICLSFVAYIVYQVRIATKRVYKHQLRRESLDVRFHPKQASIAGDVLDSVKATKLSVQRSFTDSVKKFSGKHQKTESVSFSQSMGNGQDTPNGTGGVFEMPETKLPPSLNDEEEQDCEEDPELPPMITTPKRAPELKREWTLDANGNMITKISVEEMTNNEKQLFKLDHAVKRMRNLLLGLIALVILLLTDCIVQYNYFGKIVKDTSNINRYSHPSIVQVVVIYLSIWSFVQIILLVYTWIPGRQFSLEQKRRRSKQTRKEVGDASTTKSADDSSGAIPM